MTSTTGNTNNFINTGDEQRLFGYDSTWGGWRDDPATDHVPEEPPSSEGGGSPERALATGAGADQNTANDQIEMSEPPELVGLERLRESQNGPHANNRPLSGTHHELPEQTINKEHTQDPEMHNTYTQETHTYYDATQGNCSNETDREGDVRQGRTPCQSTPKIPRKGAMRIATLNIRGAGSGTRDYKWNEISSLIMQERIDILAVQETHLDEENTRRLNKVYEKRLHFISTLDETTSNRMGVVVIMNKRSTRWKEATWEVITKGRALLVKVPWLQETSFSCMAVYAPNQSDQNKTFWKNVENNLQSRRHKKPTYMLGDFNIVEDSVDRLPPHADPSAPVNALIGLKMYLSMADGWRREHPEEVNFSFRSESNLAQSRIDRIYIREELIKYTHKWEIKRTGLNTDHLLVQMSITNPWLPHRGAGRYAMPTFLLRNEPLIRELNKIGKVYHNKAQQAREHRTKENNPQFVHKRMKEEMMRIIRQHAKCITSKIDQNVSKLEEEKQKVLNHTVWDECKRGMESALLDERIKGLKRVKLERIRDNTETRFFLEGELLQKTWINANKESVPRDIIVALKDQKRPGKPLVRRSDRMANIAKEYHDELQKENKIGDADDHEKEIKKVLNHVKRKLNKEQKKCLAKNMTEEEIRSAIEKLPNGKAAGLDGIPQEIWKNFMNAHQSEEDKLAKNSQRSTEENNQFDVVKYLTTIYNDIEDYGIEPQAGFADGWLCPIYKKGDRTDIGNYRPITVLNTDYKIFTKAIANRLSKVTPDIIHPDQAGFIKGRRIEDQTELANLVIEWGEKKNMNGTIVCLDQEKAYDKIRHRFLWATLESFGFPKQCINTLKTLYAEAKTTVIINGEKSVPYQVHQGVRQGDPMSCLLFNLAIESLAQMIREANLKGMEIEGEAERLIVKLFADDTTVYLSEKDDINDLNEILDSWCKASGGRFNNHKTAIVPVGNEEFRRNLIKTRKASSHHTQILTDVRIAPDGETTCLLGSFIGNKTDQPSVWAPTIEKITRDLERWNKGHPTIDGRRLIIGMVVGGRTQYRTCVQGMPPEIEQRLTRVIRNFIWGDVSHPTVGLETLSRPIEQGGKKLLDLKARNEAIELMKTKRFLDLSNKRLTWAKIADQLIETNLLKKWKLERDGAYKNIFLQSLSANVRESKDGLTVSLRRMLKIAKKYGVKLTPTKLPLKQKLDMPIWYHTGLTGMKYQGYNTAAAKCQRKNHSITTVRDLLNLIKEMNRVLNPGHKPRKNCKCDKCKVMREKGCRNPHRCGENARKLLRKLNREWDPLELEPQDETQINEEIAKMIDPQTSTIFKKQMRTGNSLGESIRVFTTENVTTQEDDSAEQAPQVLVRRIGPADWVQVYTDGSCTNNGYKNAIAGAGIWYGNEDPRNTAMRVPEHITQSNNSGEALAILIAVKNTNTNDHLEIPSDSQISIEGLTKSLQRWEDNGWVGVENREILQAAASHMRARVGQTIFTKVKGHSGVVGNDEADALAKKGTQTQLEIGPDLSPARGFYEEGAKLSEASQALLYRDIMEKKQVPWRKGTTINLDITRWAVADLNESLPTDRNIWKSLKDRTLTKESHAFLWKAMHNAYKMGEYWDRIPNYEMRSKCHICDTTEDLEHALTQCKATGQEAIWELTGELCRARGLTWGKPSLGLILGCNLAKPKCTDGTTSPTSNQMFRIAVSESARLIWKMRCEWKIKKEADPEKIATEKEVVNRWVRAMGKRIKMDCLASDERRHGKRALKEDLVLSTWAGIAQEHTRAYRAWESAIRVLVGMGSKCPPGRNR